MIIIQSTVFFFQDLWRTSTISISYPSQHPAKVSSTEKLLLCVAVWVIIYTRCKLYKDCKALPQQNNLIKQVPCTENYCCSGIALLNAQKISLV